MASREHKYWVYIMASLSGTLYIGITGKFHSRVLQHKAGEVEGFSRQYKCNRLVYYESLDDVKKAIGREKQLKGWRRSKKIALIERMNPRWEDLAEHWGQKILFRGQSMGQTS
jgi:putative endonuclease